MVTPEVRPTTGSHYRYPPDLITGGGGNEFHTPRMSVPPNDSLNDPGNDSFIVAHAGAWAREKISSLHDEKDEHRGL